MDIRMSNIASPMPQIRAKFTNKLGIPLSGCKVYTYEPNSDIPKTTWIDTDKTVENTNPILLDAAGEADIFLDGLYRVVVKDRFGFVVYDVEKTGTHAEWDASFVVDASGDTQQDVNDYNGTKWRNKIGGYNLNARVQLDSGAIVRSVEPSNTNNPNSNLQGWVFDSTLLIEYFGALDGFDCSLAVQAAFNYLHKVGGGCVSTNLKNIVISQVCTYHDNTTVDFNGANVRFINDGVFTNAVYNADKTSFVPATPVESYYTHTATSSAGNPLSTIASNAMRKAQTILVTDATGFSTGDYIFVSNGYCDMWRVMEKYESEGLPSSRSFQDWVRPDVDLWRCEIAKIKNIIGNTIYLEDQLVNDYPLSVKTYGFFSDENNLAGYQGYNTPRIERLGGASNCKFRNTNFLNDGNTHSLIAYASFGVTTQGCTFNGAGKGVEYYTCFGSHILDSFSSTGNFGQSIRRGSALCTIDNATAEYVGGDAPVILWEGSNLCVVNNIKVDGTQGNTNHAKIGFYFNTCWDCVGSNFTGKNLADVVSVQFCRGGITVDNIIGVNVGNLILTYASFGVVSNTGVKRGHYKDSITDYDAALFTVSESFDVQISGLKDNAKYQNDVSSGRAHIFRSFGVDIGGVSAPNIILWNSVDDDKRYEPSDSKMKVKDSSFKSGFVTQTYGQGQAQTRLTVFDGVTFKQNLSLNFVHNVTLRNSRVLGQDVDKSIILTGSYFLRLIDSFVKNASIGIDFKGTDSAVQAALSSMIYLHNTVVQAPTKFLNYKDPTDLILVNLVPAVNMNLKNITTLTDYPAMNVYANPTGDGNQAGWTLVQSSKAVNIESKTSAQLQAALDPVNSVESKWLGREVYNATIQKFMRARGSATTSAWISSDGANTITPA